MRMQSSFMPLSDSNVCEIHVSTVQKVLSLISALWTETNTVPFFSSRRDTGPVATVPGARENEENPVIVVKEVKKKVSKRVCVCVCVSLMSSYIYTKVH